MSRKYLLSILIGFLIFSGLYIYYNHFSKMTETFVVVPTGPTTDTPATPATPISSTISMENALTIVTSLKTLLNGLLGNSTIDTFTYIEDKTKIPNYENLIIYLSTYSNFTSYDKGQANYIPAANKLFNHISNTDAFMIVTSGSGSGTLPTSIAPPNGLPLLNKQITGVPSSKLNPGSLELEAFTVSFFVKISDFDFSVAGTQIDIFKIFFESPNSIRVYVTQNTQDNTKVNIVTIFGNNDNTYTIAIAKDALKASGNPILMSFTYNKRESATPKLYIYLGETSFSAPITAIPSFVLGNSPIKINDGGKWDANLHGFMYFKNSISLETHKKIIEYFNLQTSGVATIIEQLNKLTTDQVAKINEMILGKNTTITTIQKDLEECRVTYEKTVKEAEKKEEEKWVVKKDGFATVSSDELKKCTLLNVPNPYAAAAASGTPSTPPAAAGAAATGTGTGITSGSANTGTGTTPTLDKFTIQPLDILKDVKSFKPDLSKVTQIKTGLVGEIASLFSK